MAFKYDYVPVEQLEDTGRVETRILAEGEAHFIVKSIFEKDQQGNDLTTVGGDPKIRVLLTVTDKTGQKGAVWHDISSKMAWAVAGLCNAVGMPQLYAPGRPLNTSSLVGLDGKCMIETRPAEGKYEAKTIIKKYLQHPGTNEPRFNGPDLEPVFEEDESLPF